MANLIKIKRSAVAGKVPAVGDLALGELALNTYEGKLYTKKDNGTATIVEIGAGGGGGGGGGNSFTASDTAPVAPNGGDLWLDKTSGILYLYSNDGNSSQWVEHAAPIEAPGFVASANPPTVAMAGDEWLDTDTGITYKYFDSFWVEVGAGGAVASASLDIDPVIAGMIF